MRSSGPPETATGLPDVRVAADHLVGDGAGDVGEGEAALLLGHAGMEDDLEQQVARLQAAGVSITLKPWGAADGVDPEGNVFQLTAL